MFELKSKFKQIAITLINICFIVSVCSFYTLVFVIPIFVIGVILLWCSKSNILTKLLFTIAPVILYIPSVILFLYIYNYSPKKIIVLPHIDAEDFYIIYEEPNGVDYQKIDGYKSLTVPDNMICISSEKFDGHLNFEYRLEKNNKLIPMILEPADTANYEMGILAGETGVLMVSTEQEKKYTLFKILYLPQKQP